VCAAIEQQSRRKTWDYRSIATKPPSSGDVVDVCAPTCIENSSGNRAGFCKTRRVISKIGGLVSRVPKQIRAACETQSNAPLESSRRVLALNRSCTASVSKWWLGQFLSIDA